MGVHTPIKISLLRDRDGDDCWLCGGKLDFDAPSGTKKRPTREHLVALANDGPNSIDNTVLCHFGCNQQLNNRPLVEKLKIRDKRRDNRFRQIMAREALARNAPKASTPAKQSRNADRGHQRSLVGWALALLFAGLSFGQWIG